VSIYWQVNADVSWRLNTYTHHIAHPDSPFGGRRKICHYAGCERNGSATATTLQTAENEERGKGVLQREPDVGPYVDYETNDISWTTSPMIQSGIISKIWKQSEGRYAISAKSPDIVGASPWKIR